MRERAEWAACRQRTDDEVKRLRLLPSVLVETDRGVREVTTSWREWTNDR
jgi:hypothetical protein